MVRSVWKTDMNKNEHEMYQLMCFFGENKIFQGLTKWTHFRKNNIHCVITNNEATISLNVWVTNLGQILKRKRCPESFCPNIPFFSILKEHMMQIPNTSRITAHGSVTTHEIFWRGWCISSYLQKICRVLPNKLLWWRIHWTKTNELMEFDKPGMERDELLRLVRWFGSVFSRLGDGKQGGLAELRTNRS